jgi:SAM-dependent methyltransferase
LQKTDSNRIGDWNAAVAVLAAAAGIARSLGVTARRASGRTAIRHSEDRTLLEGSILPDYVRDPGISRILFCGCASYTRHYEALFAGREYWTIDAASRHRHHGAARHVVDSLQRLAIHFPREYFDLIVCNGVLGWGLNTVEDAEAAVSACYRTLRPEGQLLLGWNDVWPRNRVAPDRIPALSRFQRTGLCNHPARLRLAASHRHVFDFYRKPPANASAPTTLATAADSITDE